MRGRLLSLLRAARGVLNGLHHPPSRQPVMPLSPRRLTGFALDIARGMEYIAEKKVRKFAGTGLETLHKTLNFSLRLFIETWPRETYCSTTTASARFVISECQLT